uniref:Uncharacterized protein n=1 Tax=Aegilops tauschii subsp. strangulata TaxID=200361 RepID=A0A452XW95_AEGTS
ETYTTSPQAYLTPTRQPSFRPCKTRATNEPTPTRAGAPSASADTARIPKQPVTLADMAGGKRRYKRNPTAGGPRHSAGAGRRRSLPELPSFVSPTSVAAAFGP